MKYPTSLLLLIFIFLSGCSISIKPDAITAAEELKPGMYLELKQPIKVNPHTGYIYIQNGNFISQSELDQYYTYCRIEMFKPSEHSRKIRPDRFTISKIISQTEYVMLKPLKLATLGTLFANGVERELYYTKLYLKSGINPDVELISCEYWRDPGSFEGHVTLESIKKTLDGIFQLTDQ